MGRIKRPKHGPEWYIQRDLMAFMRIRGWLVERMTGNMYQKGIPDLYCFNRKWGERWVDVKNPGKYDFTDDQKRKWPVWDDAGRGIYILTAATQEEYDKLFGPPNMMDYWKPSWNKKFNLEVLLMELREEMAEEQKLIE